MSDSDSSIHSLIIKYLVAHTQCSGCGHRYRPEDVRVRDRRGHIWLASVTCRHCDLQRLIMAAIETKQIEASETSLDADAEERAAFQEMGPIDTDEVLDFHCFLEEFSGDMVQLLGGHGGEL